jgi:hypothetical protein
LPGNGTVHNGLSLKIWGLIMLDRDGFRPNVGIILLNQKKPGVLGQAHPHPQLAVSARWH